MPTTKWTLILAGLPVLAYWIRVLIMARRQRRRTGRAANFLPPEPLGRFLRLIWIPTVLAWTAAPFLAAANAHPHALFAPLYAHPLLQAAGALLALAAFAATLYCWKFMGKAWRMGIDPAEKNPLVIAGPFALVRHPIYALSTLMMLGTLLAVASPLILGAGVVHISLLQWESRREEKHMFAIHGEHYAQYCQKVNRFVPRAGAFLGRRAAD